MGTCNLTMQLEGEGWEFHLHPMFFSTHMHVHVRLTKRSGDHGQRCSRLEVMSLRSGGQYYVPTLGNHLFDGQIT